MDYPSCTIRRACLASVPCLTVILLLLATFATAVAAVDLVYFRAAGAQSHILVEWQTAQELDNAGFKLHRAEVDDRGQASILADIPSECPGGLCGAYYSYTDADVLTGITYYYWLEAIDLTGGSEFYGSVSASLSALPTATPTRTATPSPTFTLTATPTSTPTSISTPTPTATLAGTATHTATSTPHASSTPEPASTAAPARTTATPSEPADAAAPTTGEGTATPTSASLIAAVPTSLAEIPARIFQSERSAEPGPGAAWPTFSITSVLLVISAASFLGVLLLAIAAPLVRKLGL